MLKNSCHMLTSCLRVQYNMCALTYMKSEIQWSKHMQRQFGDAIIGQTWSFWMVWSYEEGWMSIRSDWQLAGPSASKNFKSVAEVRDLVWKKRRLTINEISREILLWFSQAVVIESMVKGSASAEYLPLPLTLEIQVCFKMQKLCKDITGVGECLLSSHFLFLYLPICCLKI